jgi:glycosyltransferase involved in cell wall biosynthesis
MANALISVLIPVYNAEKYIAQCLEAVLRQTHVNLEVLIADDGSTDKTKEILTQYTDPRIHLLHNDSNQGNLKTVNKLLSSASGDYIALQDADDWSTDDRLEIQLAEIREKALDVVFAQTYITDEHGHVKRTTNYPLNYEVIREKLIPHFPFICPSALFKKEMLEQVGLFPAYFLDKSAVDWYFFGRMIQIGKAGNTKKKLYYYRQHAASITTNLKFDLKRLISGHLVVFLLMQREKHNDDGLHNPELHEQLSRFETELVFAYSQSKFHRNYDELSNANKNIPFRILRIMGLVLLNPVRFFKRFFLKHPPVDYIKFL